MAKPNQQNDDEKPDNTAPEPKASDGGGQAAGDASFSAGVDLEQAQHTEAQKQATAAAQQAGIDAATEQQTRMAQAMAQALGPAIGQAMIAERMARIMPSEPTPGLDETRPGGLYYGNGFVHNAEGVVLNDVSETHKRAARMLSRPASLVGAETDATESIDVRKLPRPGPQEE